MAKATHAFSTRRRTASKNKATKRRPSGDAPLLDLADQYIAAEAESERLCTIVNELEGAFLDKGRPEALRVRPGDVNHGIRAFLGRLGEQHNLFNIGVLRGADGLTQIPRWK